MSKILRSMAIVFAVLLVGSSDLTYASECKANVQGRSEAIYIVKEVSYRSAKNLWRAAVTAKYGSAWSSWSRAASRTVKCDRIGTKYGCVASANPCL